MLTDKYPNFSRQKVLILVYVPWLISVAVQIHPIVSYFVAWLGSFYIFYLTLFSKVKFIPHDLPLNKQVMRPIVLIQLIFAGFMCCTSFFYFMDHMGYEYFSRTSILPFKINEQTYFIAKCQRMSLLAHAALVTGMIVQIKQFPVIKHKLNLNLDFFLIWLCVGCYLIGGATSRISSIAQFSYGLINISITCSALVFVRGIVQKKRGYMIFGGGLFLFNFLASTLTGYKESIIINIIIISFLVYPYYKKLILTLALPTIYVLIYILPTFATIIRTQAWSGQKSASEARQLALDALINEGEMEIQDTNWEFLTNRLSEINMFATFVKHIPNERGYYGLEIVKNSFLAIVPRALWPNKFVTETISMERVYEAGVAFKASTVSAKTRPVVDGYVSAGLFGVFISIFLYGWVAQWICNKAEEWFGGYELGCIVVFNAIFQNLWRGNNFEFLINNIFYGFIAMYAIYWILKRSNTLTELHVYKTTADNGSI
ncbi:MAG: exosortase Y-associated Wzy-like protein [Bacteroidia bacterium]